MRKYADIDSVEALWADILAAISGERGDEAITDEEIDEITGQAQEYPNGDGEDY